MRASLLLHRLTRYRGLFLGKLYGNTIAQKADGTTAVSRYLADKPQKGLPLEAIEATIAFQTAYGFNFAI